MPRPLLAVLLLLALVIGATLGFFNADPVQFNYLFGVMQVRLVVLVLFTFVVGALLSLLLCSVRMLSLSGDARRLRRRLRDAETELKNLRNLSIGTDH